MCLSKPSSGVSAQQQQEATNEQIMLQTQTSQAEMAQQQQIADSQLQFQQQQQAYQQQQDTAAQQQAQQQADLQTKWASGQLKNIQTGTDAVNQAFSQFTPQYFQQYAQNLYNSGSQQIGEQAGLAKRDIALNLARGGNLDSSSQGFDMGQLTQQEGEKLADYSNQSQDAANQLAQQYANTKQSLINQVSSTATIGQPSAPGTLAGVTQGLDAANRSEAAISNTAQDVIPSMQAVTPPSVATGIFSGLTGSVGSVFAGSNAAALVGAYNKGYGGGPSAGSPGGSS